MAASQALRPAGFWQRSVAWSIDTALVAPLALLLAWPWLAAPARSLNAQVQALLQVTGRAMGEAMSGAPTLPDASLLRDHIATTHSALWSLAWPALLAFSMLGAVYHIAGERSPWQGSLGKRLLELRVCDRRGRPLAPGRAALRYLAASLSWITLNLGHLMAALPPTHRALHDRLSGTQVLATGSGLPRWAWGWLGLLALVGVVATAGLARQGSAILRAALESALY